MRPFYFIFLSLFLIILFLVDFLPFSQIFTVNNSKIIQGGNFAFLTSNSFFSENLPQKMYLFFVS